MPSLKNAGSVKAVVCTDEDDDCVEELDAELTLLDATDDTELLARLELALDVELDIELDATLLAVLETELLLLADESAELVDEFNDEEATDRLEPDDDELLAGSPEPAPPEQPANNSTVANTVLN